MADKKKIAVGLGAAVAAIGIILLGTKAKAAPPLPGLAYLYGTVTDATTGLGLGDVSVTAQNSEIKTAITNPTGYYELELPSEVHYTAIIRKLGYKTSIAVVGVLEPGASIELTVQLEPIPPGTVSFTIQGTGELPDPTMIYDPSWDGNAGPVIGPYEPGFIKREVTGVPNTGYIRIVERYLEYTPEGQAWWYVTGREWQSDTIIIPDGASVRFNITTGEVYT